MRRATDMIALAAAMRVQAGCSVPERSLSFDVRPRWALAAIEPPHDACGIAT